MNDHREEYLRLRKLWKHLEKTAAFHGFEINPNQLWPEISVTLIQKQGSVSQEAAGMLGDKIIADSNDAAAAQENIERIRKVLQRFA